MIPTVIFDTREINALEKVGTASEPLIRLLKWEFKVILNFMNAEELAATPDPEERESLLARYERLWRLGPIASARRMRSCDS